MANYVQLNQGLRNMADLTGRVLDYKTKNRQLDIHQQDADRADRDQEERFHQARMQEGVTLLQGIGHEMNLRREAGQETTLGAYIQEQPGLIDAAVRSFYDPRKLEQSARAQGGAGFGMAQVDADGKVRFYMKNADGSLAPMNDVGGKPMEFDPEGFMRAQEAKALSFGYYDGYRSQLAVTPDQAASYTGGGGAAPGAAAPGGTAPGASAPVANAPEAPGFGEPGFAKGFVDHYGFGPSAAYGVAMEGDLVQEAPLMARFLEANRNAAAQPQAQTQAPAAQPPAAQPPAAQPQAQVQAPAAQPQAPVPQTQAPFVPQRASTAAPTATVQDRSVGGPSVSVFTTPDGQTLTRDDLIMMGRENRIPQDMVLTDSNGRELTVSDAIFENRDSREDLRGPGVDTPEDLERRAAYADIGGARGRVGPVPPAAEPEQSAPSQRIDMSSLTDSGAGGATKFLLDTTSGIKGFEDYYPTLGKGVPDNAYDAGAVTRELATAPLKVFWDFLHPPASANQGPTLGDVGTGLKNFAKGVFNGKPPGVSQLSKDPLPGEVGKQVGTAEDVISFVEAAHAVDPAPRTSQEQVMVNGLAQQVHAIEVDGTRFKDNSKEARARRAAIWAHTTRLATGRADEVGVRNLMSGDDAAGTAALEFGQQMETMRKFLDADIKMREQLSKEERETLKFNREQNEARLDDFAEMIHKRSSGRGEFGGRIQSEGEVRHAMSNKFVMNHAFLTHIGAPPNMLDMDPVLMNQFLRGVEQALRLDGTQTGGWLFGINATTRDTRDQLGVDIMPPIVAATTWAAVNGGKPGVEERLKEFLKEHGEVEGWTQLGELLLKQQAGNGLVSEDE